MAGFDATFEFDAKQYVDFHDPCFITDSFDDEEICHAWFLARKSILEKPADAMTMEEIEAIQSSEQPQAAQSSDAQVEEEEAEDEGIPLSVELAAPAMKPVDLVQAVVEPEEEVKEKRTAKRQMRTNWGRSKIEKKSATTTTSSSASLSEVAADVASSSSAPTNKRTNSLRRSKSVRSASGPIKSVNVGAPSMLQRAAHRRTVVTSEQLELEQIEEAKHEAEKLKEMSRRSYNVLKGASALSTELLVKQHSDKPLTVPEPFNFETDRRLKKRTHSMKLRERSVKNKPTKQRSGPIVPVPFNFSKLQSAPKPSAQSSEQFIPLAASVMDFQQRTPTRYHKPPAKDDVFKPSQKFELKSTVANSPNITKPKDKKPQLTWEELQIEELKSVKPFKARPVNSAIMESECGQYGVPRINPKPCTMPMSPMITKSVKKQIEEVQESIPEFHAAKVPDFSNPFKPRREKKTTAVLPFSEHVYTDPWQAREQLAREEEEKLRQARVFKAQPIVDAKFEVNVEHKSTTNPQPFELQSEKIAAERKQQFIEKVQKLSEEERKHREFKAQPAKVLESDPFVPARSIKVLTNTTNVELHSEKRAKERKAYDEQLAKAQAEQERLQAELERRAKEEEEKEIKDLRNQLVHKAQPVKKFKNVLLKGSVQTLTEPKSPAWTRKTSIRM